MGHPWTANPSNKTKRSGAVQCVRLSAIALVVSWAGLLFYVLRPASNLDSVISAVAPTAARVDNLGVEESVRVDDVAIPASAPPRANGVSRGALEKKWDVVGIPHATLMERDGFAMERDEQTNLQVPVFWEPPAGSDQLDHMDMIDGEPTIFLMIASYRDWQCRDTATSALERATSESVEP